MSARKNDRGKDSRDEDERKESKPTHSKDGNPSKSEIDDLAKLIKKHSSQSAAGSLRKRSDSSCEDSDSMESRFKTPPAKRKRVASTPSAPKKGKETATREDTSDESGDEVHRRSKKLLETENRSKARRKTETTTAATKKGKDAVEGEESSEESGDDGRNRPNDQLDSETVKDLRKVIANQKKKLKSTLKSQTIKICSDLDKKNKALSKENENLNKENEELKMASKSGEDKKKTKQVQEKLQKVKEERNKAEEENVDAKKNLERVRRQRNEAEDKAAKYKKEREALTKELREVRGDAKKERETLAKELREVKEDAKVKGKEIVSLKRLLEEFDGEDDEVADAQDSSPTSKNTSKKDSKEEKVNEPVDLSSNSNDDKKSKDITSGSSTAPTKEAAALESSNDSNETAAAKPTQEASAAKPTQEPSKAVDKPDEVIEEISSGEEWEGTTFFKIGHHLVKNVKFSKDSPAIGAKLPHRIVKETMRFTGTSLNNKITFIATNTKSHTLHDPTKGSSVCSLTPVCTRRWVKGEPIAIVLIIDSAWHPENEKEQWVCGHHHEASIRGHNLQMQKLQKKNHTKKAPPADPFKGLEDFKKPRRVSTESKAVKEGVAKGDDKK